VYGIQSQPSRDAFPIFLGYFVHVNINHQRQESDYVPLEIIALTQNIERHLGYFWIIHGAPPQDQELDVRQFITYYK
jgi:hypothetical protein